MEAVITIDPVNGKIDVKRNGVSNFDLIDAIEQIKDMLAECIHDEAVEELVENLGKYPTDKEILDYVYQMRVSKHTIQNKINPDN